ncbi:MAG: YidC/Oxa1 family insertase periplasmic-domain containing protein [Planctomycetota bacterium]|nr:YidC/Oxa1 family insertase periplasmic-domain containing protein [Planctomycetota bacterium]
MDRRFTLWLLLTTMMCLIYLNMVRPNPKDAAGEDPAAAREVTDPLAEAPISSGAQPEKVQPENKEPEAETVANPSPDNPRRTVTLGSMDPAKGFNQLITLSSLGASLEKAELVAQSAPGVFRYRAIEQKGGYLGYLSLTPEMVITSVPDGSPAALATSNASAGIQVDDVLTSLNGTAVTSSVELNDLLTELAPGTSVAVQVNRAGSTIDFTATLGEVPLDVLRTQERSAEFITGNNQRTSLRTTLGSLNSNYIPFGEPCFPSLKDTLQANWAVEELKVPEGQGVQFRLPLTSYLNEAQPRNLDIVKRYRLLPAGGNNDGHILDIETIIENKNDVDVRASFRQEGPTGLTLEGWWYSNKISPYMFSGAGNRDVVYHSLAKGHQVRTTRQIFAEAKDTPQKPELVIFGENDTPEARELKYIGVDAQYFNASLLSQDGSLKDLRQAACVAVADPDAINRYQQQATNTSFWFDTKEQVIPAGGAVSKNYQMYIGPKDSKLLEAHGLGQAIEYGWFGFVARPLASILHFFFGFVGNYGIAIVMLTVVVRSFLFPFSRKAMLTSQKMQAQMQVLQPEMKVINEKYKDDIQKRSQAMQELYKKHNFNPAEQLSGCLPLFIQMPIFMGLFRCLSCDVSLRQEPLVAGMSWCSNLAGPDMFADWSGWMIEYIAGKGTGWLGPYFNLLPILTVLLFIVQQKMLMPKATDDQQRVTQNMMMVMTCFMGVMFFRMPAGMCIYFITSSLWSLVERKLIKRTIPPSENQPSGDTDGKGGTGSSGTSNPTSKKERDRSRRKSAGQEKPKSRLEELKEMLEKPAVKSGTQRGPAPSKNKRKKKKR